MNAPSGKLIATISQKRGGLFSKRKKIDIYSDGYSLRQYDDDKILSEGLWAETRDVTWPPPQQNAHVYAHSGGLVGMLIVMLIEALLSSRGSSTEKATPIYIHPADNSRKITLDASFNDPQPAGMVMMPAARDVWVNQATREMNSGGSVAFGKLQVANSGITLGKDTADWSQILDAQYADEGGTIAITWANPAKKNPQTLRIPLGYRGEALMQIINQKTGKKSTSMASKLGKL